VHPEQKKNTKSSPLLGCHYRVPIGDTGLYLLDDGDTATGSRVEGEGTSSVLGFPCFGKFAVVNVSKIGLCCCLSNGDDGSCGVSTPSSMALIGDGACQSGGGGASRLMP